MSLKAKIEAVIYASEEPVTLAQLAGLLGHEGQAELDHLESAQHRLALEEAADKASGDEQAGGAGDPDEDALNNEVLAAGDAQGDDRPRGETEVQHAEALDRHLHEVAAVEAAHAKAARERAAAATAAMSSGDSLDEPVGEGGEEFVEAALQLILLRRSGEAALRPVGSLNFRERKRSLPARPGRRSGGCANTSARSSISLSPT